MKLYRNGTPLYIIDGYNVIFNPKFKDRGRDIERARSALVRYVEDYASRKKVEFEIFWDGGAEVAGARKDGYRVREFFTKSGQSADERIIRRVERLENKRRAIIVTNDRRHIAGIVKYLGTRVMSVEEFLELVAPVRSNSFINEIEDDNTSEDEKRIADDLSVDEWLELFRRDKGD